MNIDCEIGIRGDTCQCSALSLGCRRAWGPLSRCHSGVPALQHSQSRHIPFVSAQRSLFTFHRLDIPIRGGDYLPAASSPVSSPPAIVPSLISPSRRVTRSARPCLSSSFSPFVFLTVYLPHPHPRPPSTIPPSAADLRRDMGVRTRLYPP